MKIKKTLRDLYIGKLNCIPVTTVHSSLAYVYAHAACDMQHAISESVHTYATLNKVQEIDMGQGQFD